MSSSHESSFSAEEKSAFVRELDRQREAYVDEVTTPSRKYLFRLGRVPVELSLIEFRIVAFLSNTPYKAYTRRQIVAAISTEKQSVDEDGLDEHIRTLRDKLGIFSDFVQSVPHIGYRFKP